MSIPIENPEHWHSVITKAVHKAVPNQRYTALAAKMARSTERAADYFLQAPVLVLAASLGKEDALASASNFIVGTFAERCKRGPKLRHLMNEYGIAYPFRALRGPAIAPSKSLAIIALSEERLLHPSALAQAIPTNPRDQQRWLRALMDWGDQMARRDASFTCGMGWAASTVGKIAGRTNIEVEDIADFYSADPACFSARWSFDQAKAATERWHRRLAKQVNEEDFFTKLGVGFSEQIDYGDLPLESTIFGMRIVALNSGEELFAEGMAMRHCVGSYSAGVIRGKSRIFSIRDGDQRLATLELARPSGVKFEQGSIVYKAWEQIQLKGPCNGKPAPSAVKVAITFLALVNEGKTVRLTS